MIQTIGNHGERGTEIYMKPRYERTKVNYTLYLHETNIKIESRRLHYMVKARLIIKLNYKTIIRPTVK